MHLGRKLAWLVVGAIVFCCACTSPTGPTGTKDTSIAASQPPGPLALNCPAAIAITAPSADGASITYDTPTARSGDVPLNVICTPQSGSIFPVGATTATCTATDTLNRTSSCSFSVTVGAPVPRLRFSRFVAFGDSVTVGEVVVPNTDNVILDAVPSASYPTVLRELLTTRYVGQDVSVVNAGLSGEKSINALSRFSGAVQGRADAVIILEGYNDLLYASAGDGLVAAEAGVSALAADARNRGVRVFISTLSPTKPGRRQIAMSTIQAANDRLRVVARGEGAYLIDVFSALLPDVNNNICSDGLHPTELGYHRIAETVFAAIRADLEIR